MKLQLKNTLPLWIGCLSLGLASCTQSLYSPVSSNDSVAAKKEDAIIALNNDDYAAAAEKLKEIMDESPSNEIAQLYSTAVLGLAGFNLFDIIKNVITLMESGGSGDEESSSGNSMLDKLPEVVGTPDADALETVLSAIDILNKAPNPDSSGLVFQKCLTAGIYAAPTLQSALTKVEELQAELQALPTKLGGATQCGASSDVIAETGAALTSSIQKAGEITAGIKLATDALGDCLPEGTDSQVNGVTSKVNKLQETADKGCALPDTGQVGSLPLPTCMNSYVLETAATAQAGDKVISGCEVFLNCMGGGCFE